MIFSCKVSSLEPAKYGDQIVKLEQLSECPICKTSISPLYLNTVFRVDGHEAHFESHQFCSKCNHTFICSYVSGFDSNHKFNPPPRLVSAEPQKFKAMTFDDSIQYLSPQFTKIYNQALAAETMELDEIAGLGYRKAMEFLIKDFAIHKNPDNSETIKKLPLAQCIRNYISSEEIKTLAERCAWIGNDEAHYIRVQEGRDVSDMKSFIQAMVYFIGMILITEDAASMIPKK